MSSHVQDLKSYSLALLYPPLASKVASQSTHSETFVHDIADIWSGDGAATYAVEGLVIGLAIVSVAFRFYARTFTKAGLWWDNWLILASVLTTVLTVILLIWGMPRLRLVELHGTYDLTGTADHIVLTGTAVDPLREKVLESTDPTYVYSPEDVLYLKLLSISAFLYFTIVSAAKLSIMCLCNRLFSRDATFRRQLIVTSVLVLGFWIGCTVATLTNCVPHKWSWINGLVDSRYCFNYNIFWVAAGTCEVFIDILILILPIQAVHRLQLLRKQKMTVIFIFLLGGL